ncbi:MAG: hypothetical protein A2289_15070 [Deltaproteobacteria bacterium RIFOXYA12_FULL_58_15]|nr:MAG: hypothetical protein A2289_15070 [Deltaproteobacteria bacterium RIFOXYA12_FULL_58_15]OGR13038.1 MAG: hypothetical protein A2341_08240 [Deltaproteobacteria bacterium RIFOXYB12_FULL_58_9]
MAEQENKIAYTEILRGLTAEKFSEVFLASSRKARETYFHRQGVRASSKKRLVKPGAKTEARISQLYDLLKTVNDDEMAEEMLRTWLLGKRELLAAALDHLGIEHEDGLTTSDDLNKFEKLGKKEIQALLGELEAHGSREDAVIYLKFMGTENVDQKRS